MAAAPGSASGVGASTPDIAPRAAASAQPAHEQPGWGGRGWFPRSQAARATSLSAAVVLLALGAVAVPVLGGPYYEALAISALILVILATGWNVIGGYGGQLSFGHAAFYGLGAYAAGWFVTEVSLPLAVALPCAILLAMAVAALSSVLVIPGFRSRGPYFAILTLAVAESFLLLGQYFLPGGQSGIFVTPVFGRGENLPYWLVLGITLAAVAASALVLRSRLGSGLRAVRSDLAAAASVGVPTLRVRVAGFAISAAIAGVAGALYALTQALVNPTTVFDPSLSVVPVLLVTLGGTGTVLGPVLGALLWAVLNDALSNITTNTGYSTIVYGGLLVLLAVFLPNGLLGLVRKYARPGAKPHRVPARSDVEPRP